MSDTRYLLGLLRRLAFIERIIPYRLVLPLRLLLQRQLGMVEPETRLLDQLVSEGDHVVDVGANAGIYSYLLSRMGCRVEAFEPLEFYLRRLRQAHLKGVQLHSVALSDSLGETEIHIPVIAGQLRRTRASIEAERGEARTQKVTLAPLDSYGFENIRFIKIDVEGHEFSVLRGAVNTIERSRPVVLVEIEEHRLLNVTIADIADWFANLGYEGYFYRNGKLDRLINFDPRQDQARVDDTYKDSAFVNNFIFSPAESVIKLPERI